MKLPLRLDNALSKLYSAFHNNTLEPECCKQCAVGNILDNNDTWKHFSDEHGSNRLNYVGLVNHKLGKRFNGYTPLEILNIEIVFLTACGFKLPLKNGRLKSSFPTSKDNLFNGLVATVSYLCELDAIDNVMDCESLFNYSPKYDELVLA